MTVQYWAEVDVGTTGVQGVLVDPQGTVIAYQSGAGMGVGLFSDLSVLH